MLNLKRSSKKKSLVLKNEKNRKRAAKSGDEEKRSRNKENPVKYTIKKMDNLRKASKKKNKLIKKRISGKQKAAETKTAIEEPNKSIRRSSKILKKDKTECFKNTGKIKKKLRSSRPIILSLCPTKSFSENLSGEKLSKHLVDLQSEDDRESTGIVDENTIFVSLDCLEDCDKYKQSFRKPVTPSELLSLHKRVVKISSYHRRYLGKRPGTRKLSQTPQLTRKRSQLKKRRKEIRSKIKTLLSSMTFEQNLKLTTSSKVRRDSSGIETVDSQFSENEVKEQESHLISEIEKLEEQEFSDLYIDLWPKYAEDLPPENNISKIDEKFFKSLLNIASNEGRKSEKGEANSQKQDSKGPSNKRMTGKAFFENKIKKRKKEAADLKIEPNDAGNKQNSPQKKTTSTRLVHNVSKSETQFNSQKGKRIREGKEETEELEMKSEKNVAYIKPQSSPGSKRRKTRNNTVKKENKESIEIPFPCEVSKAQDVQELWKRESENSLTSHSSSTVAVNDGIYDTKNLGMESYKTLKKIVEEEVHRISKKYIREKTEKEENNSLGKINEKKEMTKLNEKKSKMCDKIKSKEESEKVIKNCCEQLKMPTAETFSILDVENNLNIIAKKKMMEAEKENLPSKKEENSELSGASVKCKPQELMRLLSDEKEQKCKVPREVIKNWSILHRLENAFLALGTPNFPNKNPKDFGNSTSRARALAATEKNTSSLERFEGSKLKKGTALESDFKHTRSACDSSKGEADTSVGKIKKSPKNENNNTLSPSSSNPRTPDDGSQGKRLGVGRGKVQSNTNSKRETKGAVKTDLIYFNTPKVQDSDQTNLKQKKGKLGQGQLSTNKASTSNVKSGIKYWGKTKPGSRSGVDSANASETKPQKSEAKQSKFGYNYTRKDLPSPKKSPEVGKFGKRKSSRVLVCNSNAQNKNDEENLERKKTFDIIPIKNASVVGLQRSKSCNKIDDGSDLDNCFSSTKNNQSSVHEGKNLELWNFYDNQNLKMHQNSKTKCESNEIGPDKSKATILKTEIRKGDTTKNQTKEKTPQEKKTFGPDEKSKTANDNIRGNAEVLAQSFRGKLHQGTADSVEEFPRKLFLAKKELKMENNERAVKERSILSMRGNQHGNQIPLKNLTQIEDTNISSILGSTPDDFPQEDDKRTVNILLQKPSVKPPMSQSNASCLSTATYDLVDGHLNPPQVSVSLKNAGKKVLENSSLISAGSNSIAEDKSILTVQETSTPATSKNQSLWEQDLRYYHEIVRDIMSQYQRLGGLLKQSENSMNLQFDTESSDCFMRAEESPGFSQTSKRVNINEYRKKVMYEYNALPIFEYKSKILEKKKEGVKSEDGTHKRNLAVVNSLNPETDVDVKDYEINIQKVLDSQLYVDTKKTFKKSEPLVKEKDKNSSLQEIPPSRFEKITQQQECLRTTSTPKSFLPVPVSPVPSSPLQKSLDIKNLFFNNSSTTTTTMELSTTDFDQSESDVT